MTVFKSRSDLRMAIPWLWLTMSALWAGVIIVTDQLAWPLALWIATTVRPLTNLRTHTHQTEFQAPETKGNRK